MRDNWSFKTYLALDEKIKRTLGYIDQAADELGIDPEDMDAALKASPQVAGNITFGQTTYNLTPYKIIELIRDKDGDTVAAKIKIMHDEKSATKGRKEYLKKKGDFHRIDGSAPDTKVYLIRIDPGKMKNPKNPDINDILSQGFPNPNDPSSGAAAGGLPGIPGGLM